MVQLSTTSTLSQSPLPQISPTSWVLHTFLPRSLMAYPIRYALFRGRQGYRRPRHHPRLQQNLEWYQAQTEKTAQMTLTSMTHLHCFLHCSLCLSLHWSQSGIGKRSIPSQFLPSQSQPYTSSRCRNYFPIGIKRTLLKMISSEQGIFSTSVQTNDIHWMMRSPSSPRTPLMLSWVIVGAGLVSWKHWTERRHGGWMKHGHFLTTVWGPLIKTNGLFQVQLWYVIRRLQQLKVSRHLGSCNRAERHRCLSPRAHVSLRGIYRHVRNWRDLAGWSLDMDARSQSVSADSILSIIYLHLYSLPGPKRASGVCISSDAWGLLTSIYDQLR